jgi:hypothetical protein
MCTFTLESTHFIFHKCPTYTHDGASAKFSTNSHETGYSVGTEGRPDETSCSSFYGRAGPVIQFVTSKLPDCSSVNTMEAFWLGKIEQLYERAHVDIAEYGRNRNSDYSITVTPARSGTGLTRPGPRSRRQRERWQRRRTLVSQLLPRQIDTLFLSKNSFFSQI